MLTHSRPNLIASLFLLFPLSAINNKGSPIDYKTGSACSTPTKDTLKSYDRNCMGPVLPPRSAMCGPPSHHYSAPLNFRKGFTFTKCTWKCTAILVVLLCVILVITLLLTGKHYGVVRCVFKYSRIIREMPRRWHRWD